MEMTDERLRGEKMSLSRRRTALVAGFRLVDAPVLLETRYP